MTNFTSQDDIKDVQSNSHGYSARVNGQQGNYERDNSDDALLVALLDLENKSPTRK